MGKKGVLLLNIGSPASYQVEDVKKYLQTFLMDKDIINLPFPLRWLLVHGLIAPKRSQFSAGNYKKVWLEGEGSPLTVYTGRFAQKLQEVLGSNYVVAVGMRYSEPSIPKAMQFFKNQSVDEVIEVPLFPQFAEATTGSSVRETEKWARELKLKVPFKVLNPFFDEKAFIQNTVRLIQDALPEPVDHYLFSYHGLPESQVRKVPGCLVSETCCFEKNACAKNCYRAQCIIGTQKITEALNIPDSHWSLSFQSRLGRAEWIKPSTDDTITKLAQTGKKKIAVICPSFVADCIETLEEIGIGGEELFHQMGGEKFYLVPCLNDDQQWVEDFAQLVQKL